MKKGKTDRKIPMSCAVIMSFVLLCGLCSCLSGCIAMDVLEFIRPGGDPNDRSIREGYDRTILKMNNAADVLHMIYMPEHELLNQGTSAVAAYGTTKRGHKAWFKMVAFSEDELTTQRKYLLISDERPKFLLNDKWECLRFECELVLDKDVLNEPYTAEYSRRVAILKNVLEAYRGDLDALKAENSELNTYGLMASQGLQTVLTELDTSPVQAVKIDDSKGIEFDHINMDKGRIRMKVCDDVVKIKMWLGSLAKFKVSFIKEKFEDEPDEAGAWIHSVQPPPVHDCP